jgi:lysophospholipase L1-like esterase
MCLLFDLLEDRDLPAAFQTLPVLPFSDPAALDHARAIFALGQHLGRRSDVFMKLGDSNSSVAPGNPVTYLGPLGVAGYSPSASGLAATHPELLGTWETFLAAIGSPSVNSYTFQGPGAQPGWLASNVLASIPSEIASTDASVALIMIGTNNVGTYASPTQFQTQLNQIINDLTAAGIVPIVSTIPPMTATLAHFQPEVNGFNQIIAGVAAAHHVPLWNLWSSLQSLPNDGIDSFGIHLNSAPDGSANFWPSDLAYGQNVRNLEALQILNWFQTQIAGGRTNIPPRPPWQALPTTSSYYSVGRDTGVSPTVDVYDSSGNLMDRFRAFGDASVGGVRVATGDLNGDGFTDVVCATGAGTTGQVEIFSGQNGSVMRDFVPFGTGYTGGLSVAVGDVNGVEDLVVGKTGGNAAVRVYQDLGGSWTQVCAFHAFPRGGVSVAVANVAGQGSEIAIGSAASPTVSLFSPTGTLLSSLNVPGVSGGVTVAAADLKGDGTDELAVASTRGSNQVQVMDPVSGAVLTSFAVGSVTDPAFGIRLGTLRKSSGTDTLLVGNAPGSPVTVKGFSDLSGTPTSLPPNNPHHAFGIFVG